LDKYEYKVRAEEIHNLIADGEYAEAVEIADTIDWRRVQSIKTLCTISDLYKINRRYQESKEILLMAYERYPSGRLIVYSLCELSIKLEEYVQAIEYYKEYVQLAPKDTSRYILQYRLYEAQDVSLEERIGVLEEFKRKDYREKWGYELAYLYHRMGLSSKCVDECDELIVTFGEGRYVIKAMELKALHSPLSDTQQIKYNDWMLGNTGTVTEPAAETPVVSDSISDVEASIDTHDLKGAPTTEIPQEMDIQVKTVDVGQYNTTNLQEALAESMKDIWGTDDPIAATPSSPEEDVEDNTIFGTGPMAGPGYTEAADSVNGEAWEGVNNIPGEEEVLIDEPVEEPQAEVIDTPIPVSAGMTEYRLSEPVDDVLLEETKRIPTEAVVDYLETQRLMAQMQSSTASMQAKDIQAELIPGAVTGQLETVGDHATNYDQMLAQEYDGQIRLAISEGEQIEKQITGQLSIDDILRGWEETKKENELKREEEVRMRILQHTGSLFDEFDEETRRSLLDQLEKAFLDAIIKESNGVAGESEELGKRIRKEAVRAVEVLSRETLIDVDPELASELDYAEPASEEASDDEDSKAEESAAETGEETSEEETVDTNSKSVVEADTEDESDEDEAENESDEDDTESDEDAESDEDRTEPDEDLAEEDDGEVEVDETDSEADEDEDAEDEEADIDEDESDSAEVKAVKKALEEDEKESSKRKEVVASATDSDTEESESGERELSEEEEEFYSAFLTRRSTRRQIAYALDNMSMAAYTGNILVTGEEGSGTMDLAKHLIKQMQAMDANCTGAVAKIAGKDLNGKDLNTVIEKISNGVLLIEKARGLKRSTVTNILKALENENLGLLVILEDTSEGIDRIITAIPQVAETFNVRIDLKALDDKALVNYAREYAYSREYSIDEYALLALHTRIEEMQTNNHQVTLSEVRDLVDDAIYFASKKTLGHFWDIVLQKRYDKEDMTILREKDFMHY